MKRIWTAVLGLWVVAGACAVLMAAEAVPVIYPSAILPFQERGAGVKGYGEKVSDILFAELSKDPKLYLVDRANLEDVMKEYHINLSGMVAPGQAAQVGQLTGAKVLVTGSVIEADKSLYVVAKIIGTETSRVLGESVKGRASDDIATMVEGLAKKVGATIAERSDELVAKEVKEEDRIAALAKKIGGGKKPVVMVKIPERHVGQVTIDPAAQTEMILYCKETGFEVIDATSGSSKEVDVMIEGEGFSEFAMRLGNIVSVKARLEVKAIDRATSKVIATDRQTAVEVDLTEQIAGKKALQKASAAIAERLLPKLVAK